MQVILQADQRPKQNHKDAILPAHPQEPILVGERTWTDIERQKYSLSDYTVSRQLSTLLRQGNLPRDDGGAIEFWRREIVFRINLCFVIIGLTKSGRAAWQEEEETRKHFTVVLILQEQFCTSELSKVIQDAILLILHCRTMSWFPTASSSTLITSDVQTIHILSSIQDWYREDKIWATDRQYSFCLWILWTKHKNTIILHNTA